jgi:hypothetical protein
MYNIFDEIHLMGYFPTFLSKLLTFNRDLLTLRSNLNLVLLKEP